MGTDGAWCQKQVDTAEHQKQAGSGEKHERISSGLDLVVCVQGATGRQQSRLGQKNDGAGHA